MPRWTRTIVLALVILSWIPFFLITRARSERFRSGRVHLIPDMDQQPKFRPQSANPMFLDGRAMRPSVAGTVARGELREDDHFYRGIVGGDWAATFPAAAPVTPALLKRGQQRFDIYCAPCHGLDGYGNGVVARRADKLQQGTWVQPSSYHTDIVRGRPVGHIFNTITNGIRNMPAYGPQIPENDRWAIVAYVRALQRSQNSSINDVPPGERAGLR